jgi:hypothetical protein
MAAPKLLQINASGRNVEVPSIDTTTGATDAGKVVSTGADGLIAATFLPSLLVETGVAPASENLAANDQVNFWDDSGTMKVRKADASAANAGKRSWGFVKTAVTSPANATVYFDGEISGLSGLTPGAEYFLSNSTPGGITATPVTTSGHLLQSVGFAKSATTLSFELGEDRIRG